MGSRGGWGERSQLVQNWHLDFPQKDRITSSWSLDGVTRTYVFFDIILKTCNLQVMYG